MNTNKYNMEFTDAELKCLIVGLERGAFFDLPTGEHAITMRALLHSRMMGVYMRKSEEQLCTSVDARMERLEEQVEGVSAMVLKYLRYGARDD